VITMPEAQMRKTVKEWREERELTQLELAIRAGLTPGTISNIETGRNQPRVAVAIQIAQALGVAVEQIQWLRHPKPRGKETPRAA
jgi:DNA-binding XRE family transcriptional regulator